MADDAIFAPGFKARPYWWEAAEPAPQPEPALPGRIDVAVIGGGYTGLACALELARNGTSAAVIEAEAIGYNASSRNGGIVVGGLKLAQQSDLADRYGRERADLIVQDAVGTFAFLEGLLAREKIECHFQRKGRLFCAYTKRHYDEMAGKVEGIRALTGMDAHMLPAERQWEEIGSDHYRGGMVVEAAAGLHPALYVRGLAEAARRAGAHLVDRTRMTGLTRTADGGFDVATTRGTVRAKDVMLATNGYTGRVTPWFRRRLVPVASFIIATEELAPEVTQRLIPRMRVMADTRRVLSYFRLSPDGKRLLWGGRVGTADMDPRESARRLYRAMTRVFPELAGTRITHSWNGNVAFSFDLMPHMGVHEGVHYALGCLGGGVAMMSYLGTQSALKMLGKANRPCAFDGLPFPTKPLYDGTPWFLPGVLAYYRLRDRIDRQRG